MQQKFCLEFCNCLSDPLELLSGGLVAQSGLTLCDLMDCSQPGNSVHGILQIRILSRLPFPSSGDLPDPGIKPGSPTLQADSLPSESPGKKVWVLIAHSELASFFPCTSISPRGATKTTDCLGRS